jgi:adenosylhomocysteine nucleosidase
MKGPFHFMKHFKSILVLAALQQEEEALVALLKCDGAGLKRVVLDPQLGIEATVAQVCGKSVTIVRCGIGAVNSGLTLYAAAKFQAIDAVVLLGVGGALTPELDIGDLVVSTRVLAHDYFYSFDQGDVRIRPGALVLTSDEAQGHVAEFEASADLLQVFRDSGHRIVEGAVLSGNEFAGRLERKRFLAGLHPEAKLVEMEGSGIAQVALRLGLPFIIAKTVSDRLKPEGTIESDFVACLEGACENAATILHSLLK